MDKVFVSEFSKGGKFGEKGSEKGFHSCSFFGLGESKVLGFVFSIQQNGSFSDCGKIESKSISKLLTILLR